MWAWEDRAAHAVCGLRAAVKRRARLRVGVTEVNDQHCRSLSETEPPAEYLVAASQSAQTMYFSHALFSHRAQRVHGGAKTLVQNFGRHGHLGRLLLLLHRLLSFATVPCRLPALCRQPTDKEGRRLAEPGGVAAKGWEAARGVAGLASEYTCVDPYSPAMDHQPPSLHCARPTNLAYPMGQPGVKRKKAAEARLHLLEQLTLLHREACVFGIGRGVCISR